MTTGSISNYLSENPMPDSVNKSQFFKRNNVVFDRFNSP